MFASSPDSAGQLPDPFPDPGRAFQAVSPAAYVLDRRLHELRMAQQAAAATIADLEGEDTYAFLVAGDGLTGTTASRVRPALDRVAELRDALDRLDEMLDQVSSLRDAGHVDDPRATDLVALLNSPSITVPAPPDAGPHTEGTALAPQDLLATVDETVARVRAVLAEVDGAWREFLPRLERAMADGDRLALALPTYGTLADARSLMTVLPDIVVEDPLGAADELARVEAALADVDRVRDQVGRLREVLTAAGDTLTELEALIAEGRHALDRSRIEIANPRDLLDPIDPVVVGGERGLRPWLARLDRLVGDGDVELAARGLERWRVLADQTRTAARQVVEANTGPSLRRGELQGLLRAARVKAGASGRAEDMALTELAARADRALDVPCDLAEAEARVNAYLDELRRGPTPAQARAQATASWTDQKDRKEMSA
jgi:hypothetical protein